jgi:hypothetical protein
LRALPAPIPAFLVTALRAQTARAAVGIGAAEAPARSAIAPRAGAAAAGAYVADAFVETAVGVRSAARALRRAREAAVIRGRRDAFPRETGATAAIGVRSTCDPGLEARRDPACARSIEARLAAATVDVFGAPLPGAETLTGGFLAIRLVPLDYAMLRAALTIGRALLPEIGTRRRIGRAVAPSR